MTVPIYNMTDAWTDGSLYTAIKMNVTDTSSNAASLLLDLQVASVSSFSVGKTGTMLFGSTPVGIGQESASRVAIYSSGALNQVLSIRTSGTILPSFGAYQFSSGAVTGVADVVISRLAAATVQIGAAANATPIAQTIATQGSRAGTDTDIGGGNLTVQPGIGTGIGTPSNLILKGIIGTTTGMTTQTTSTALTIAGVATGQVPSIVLGSAAIATNASEGFLYIASGAGTPTGTPTTQTGRVPLYYDTTNHQFWIYEAGAWKQPKTPAGAAIVTWQ